jgi:hypothetical protein
MDSHQIYNVVFWSTWVHIKSMMWSYGAHGLTSSLWCGLLEHMGSHQIYDVVLWSTWVHIKFIMWSVLFDRRFICNVLWTIVFLFCSFFFWPLLCLSLFDLRLLIIPLLSSTFSCYRLKILLHRFCFYH